MNNFVGGGGSCLGGGSINCQFGGNNFITATSTAPGKIASPFIPEPPRKVINLTTPHAKTPPFTVASAVAGKENLDPLTDFCVSLFYPHKDTKFKDCDNF